MSLTSQSSNFFPLFFLFVLMAFKIYPLSKFQIDNTISAGDQPRLIQGIRSGDGVGEDQETIA